MRKTAFAACLILTVFCSTSGTAAPGAGAINQSFNTSVRAEGMGSAGVAVPWGGDTNHWANPALLAYRPGVHHLSYESQLAVGLADDIFLYNEETTVGAWGVTFLVAKGPFDGNFLDMGTQLALDPGGNPVGLFDSYMKTTTWGFGVDLKQVAERAFGDRMPDWSRRFSLAVGATWSDFEDRLAPDPILMGGAGSATASSSSRGALLGVSVLDQNLELESANGFDLGVTFDLAAGYSLLNDTDEYIVHVDPTQSDPMPRTRAMGLAARLALPIRRADGGPVSLLETSLDPLVSFTFSRQELTPGYRWDGDEYIYEIDDDQGWREKSWGYEASFANVVFLRRGHLKVEAGDVDGSTSGWGVQVPVGRFCGFRYDEATVPQASGLPSVDRKSWSLWVDPLAIAQAVRD